MKPVIYGTIAAALAGVPRRYAMIEGLGFAFTDTGERSLKRRSLRMLMQGLLRIALRRAERVIFLNNDDRNELVEAGVVATGRSVVLGGIGLQLSDFQFTHTPTEGPPVFVMIGRLLKEKGVFEFVEAARIVRQHHATARFILVGGADPKAGSPTGPQLQSWIDEGLIEWTGVVADVRPYLREATTFVLPSYREGVPRSTQEAMAIGRAVVTTDVPGCRATVEPGVNGFLVPSRDGLALAQSMNRLAGDRALAITMGARSRQIAEERYDVNIVNDRLLGFINVTR
jgi:glycosyltransferase involved in cell wall biosynthesis